MITGALQRIELQALFVIAGLALAGTGLRAATVTGVTSATTIGANGGDVISYTNPNWTTGFTKISSGSETYTKLSSASAILAMAGVQVMNFESVNGFNSTAYLLGTGTSGSVFTTAGAMSPYTTADALTDITFSGGYHVGVGVRSYNTVSKSLGAASAGSGVFLVGDNSTNPAMVSGTQGLILGSISSYNGITFTFDTDISAFSVVVNCANTSGSSPTYVVVAFDAAGNALGSYVQGVGNYVAVDVGFSTSAANIRSIWVGQSTGNSAIVVDDLAFVPVPELSAGTLFSAALAGTGLLKKRMAL